MEITKFCESDFLFYEPHLWFCSFQETLTNSTGCVRSSVIESVLLALLYVLSLGDKTMFSSGWILCCHSTLMIQKLISIYKIWHLRLCKNFCRAIFHAAGTGLFWLCLLGTVIAALLPRLVVKYMYQYYFPSDIQISRETEKFGNPRDNGGGQIEMLPVSDGPPR